MTGPALKKQESHNAIHEAALNEARELNLLLSRSLEQQEYEKALELAYILIEHWETRTLRHAESEEKGLYKEIANHSKKKREKVITLSRDHDLMRKIVYEIKQMLEKEGITREVMKRFETLIIVDNLHNQDEEKLLEV